MKAPARAVVGNLVWSVDGGVWAVWEAQPFPVGQVDAAGIEGRIRGLVLALPPDSMLLSICELLNPLDVVERMVRGVPLDAHPAWATVCDTTRGWLEQLPWHRRRYYVAAALPLAKRAWHEAPPERPLPPQHLQRVITCAGR